MIDQSKTLTVNSFNCRGLRKNKKRQNIFQWLKELHTGITFLQETHCMTENETEWRKDWGGLINCSNGTSHSSSVAILIPEKLKLNINIKREVCDQKGRIILLECDIEEMPITFVNIYAPTKDNRDEQVKFIIELTKLLHNYAASNFVIGDFNT